MCQAMCQMMCQVKLQDVLSCQRMCQAICGHHRLTRKKGLEADVILTSLHVVFFEFQNDVSTVCINRSRKWWNKPNRIHRPCINIFYWFLNTHNLVKHLFWRMLWGTVTSFARNWLNFTCLRGKALVVVPSREKGILQKQVIWRLVD